MKRKEADEIFARGDSAQIGPYTTLITAESLVAEGERPKSTVIYQNVHMTWGEINREGYVDLWFFEVGGDAASANLDYAVRLNADMFFRFADGLRLLSAQQGIVPVEIEDDHGTEPDSLA